MDPDASWTRIVELAEQIGNDDVAGDSPTGYALAEAVNDLQSWLGIGGFPPAAWPAPNLHRDHITPDDARDLLGVVERGHPNAWETSGWKAKLITAMLTADMGNLRLFAKAFPGPASAVYEWKQRLDGAAFIRAKAALR
jgi:hypothetical protein